MARLKSLRTITDEALYLKLQALVQTVPDFETIDDDTRIWLGRLSALVDEAGLMVDAVSLRTQVQHLATARFRPFAIGQIKDILFRALAVAEIGSPTTAQGSFIAVGNAHDAFSAVAKILAEARSTILIVDAYMDHTLLDEFAIAAPPGVLLRVLADTANVKPSLAPAVGRWLKQYGGTRPLEARLATPRTLHDRLIQVDKTETWIATQSFAHFAVRSPATLQRFQGDNGQMKIDAYEDLWDTASPI